MSQDKASVLMVVRNYRIHGGQETVINSLCKGLSKLGHKVTIGALSFEGNPPADTKMVNLKRFKGLTYGSEAGLDIIHSHNPTTNYYSFLTSKPFVFHYHGVSGIIQRIHLKASFPLFRTKISRIIAISNSALNEFTNKIGAAKSPIDIIGNGVDTSFFHSGLPRPYTKGDPQLLFVSHLYRSKNVTRIIDNMPNILKVYPNAHLQIVGDGEDYQRLEGIIKQKRLENRVELLGNVSNDELVLRYSSCDIYISASNWEMFALSPLEAMACGKPVLLSDIPAHRELLGASNAGKVFPLEEKYNISDAITQVFNNRQSFGYAAREFALKCDWSVACKKVSRIYEEIMTRAS
jgi:glycosyltransferase involved in cell wall biosynthesis